MRKHVFKVCDKSVKEQKYWHGDYKRTMKDVEDGGSVMQRIKCSE